MDKYSYPWEKFHSAVYSLVSDGSQRDRLMYAVGSLITLKDKELPKPVKEWFDHFWEIMTALNDEHEGAIKATIQELTDDEVDKYAKEILSAYDTITRHRTP